MMPNKKEKRESLILPVHASSVYHNIVAMNIFDKIENISRQYIYPKPHATYGGMR